MKKSELRIVFMGTPEIATAALDAILKQGFRVVGVITAPDKPAGRGQKIQYSSVKQYALDNGLTLFQPSNLKDPLFHEELKATRPDVQVVVAFRMLPHSVWSLPLHGTFNMHASLLPQYRGAAPINWAIINGETKSGVTTFFLDQEIDTGKIILQNEVPLTDSETAGTLHDKLAVMGADLVVQTLNLIIEQKIEAIDQQELLKTTRELKKAPKIFREDCRIDWNKSAQSICNLIRGLNPMPGAFTELPNGDTNIMMKIFEAIPQTASPTLAPGNIMTDNRKSLQISCADGYVDVKNLQPAGKKRMKTDEFLRGFSFFDQNRL